MDFRAYVREQLSSLSTPREPEIVDELAQHLEDLYREARSNGLDHEQALERAATALTASTRAAGELRSSSRAPAARLLDRVRAALDEPVPTRPGRLAWMTDLRRDVRLALRSLVHAPGFTAVAVITLALGIGGTATIFSAIDAVLLRDAPVADPDRLVSVYTQRTSPLLPGAPAEGPQIINTSYPDYVDLRDSTVLRALAAFAGISLALDGPDGVDRIDAQIVSGNYFDVLGVRAALGRGLVPSDDMRGAPVRVVVLSHRLWQGRFGGDETLIGRAITVNGNPYTVIGVAPPGFTGPVLGELPDAWVPMALQEEVRPPSSGALRRQLGGRGLLDVRNAGWLSMVGRLHAQQPVTEAAAALEVVGRQLAAHRPSQDVTATAVPLGAGPGIRTRTQPVLTLLGATAGLVLLIACANIAGLLLTRAVARRRDVAIRMAVGAGRAQLVRQWLTEAVLLGLIGAATGLLLVRWATPLLNGLGIPESIDLSVNPRVLAFTMIVGIGSGIVFGLAPAVQFARRDVLSALRDERGVVATGARATRLRSGFVVLQVALSLVLLVGAGLFGRTLLRAYAVDLGYDVDRMLVVDLSLGEAYSPEAGQAFYEAVLERVEALPGVLSAGAARVAVLSGGSRTVGVSTDGQPLRNDRGNGMPVRTNVVSRDYLDAMGIPLIRGRLFEAQDLPTAPRVAIVSRALAQRLWPGGDPTGQRLVMEDAEFQVIGVVPDTVYVRSTELEPLPFFYQLLSQNYENGVSLHIRTSIDPMTVLGPVRQAVRELDPRLALTRPRLLADEYDRSIETERMLARLTGLMSASALLLAAVGLYGVMSYMVRLRTTEVGIRMALGATPTGIMQQVVGRGARLVALGCAIGLGGALAAVQLIRNQLFGVEPTDPPTWIAVAALLLFVGLLACVIPARRAMTVSPAAVLRSL